MADRGGKFQVRRSENLKPSQELARKLGTSTQQISRWQKKLDDPANFEAVFEQAFAKYSKILEFDTTAHVGHNSGENEWYTPAEIIEAAREVLGDIDLDPASSEEANRVVKAASFFSSVDSGLNQPWHGRIWLNPPYSQPLVSQFAEKYAQEVGDGNVVAGIVLINNATETEFFAAFASGSIALCFPRGRVRFWSPKKQSATPLQGQVLLYAGPSMDLFCRRFAEFGLVAQIVNGAA